jgi:transposase-like protein
MGDKMAKGTRARYTQEFKEEAVRLISGGERVAVVAKTLGLSEQTLHNWVRATGAGTLKGQAKSEVSSEQMEISRLRSELARVKMERDIKKSDGVLRQGVAVKYAFIERHRDQWPVSIQCDVLDLSVSGFQQYLHRSAGRWASA